MANLIPKDTDPHRETEELLPWYATGRLDAVDRARVEMHLASCAQCRCELALEHSIGRQVASLPIEAASGWAAFAQRLQGARPERPGLADTWRALRSRWGLGWQRATQLAFVTAAGVLVSPLGPPAAYQTLGTAAVHDDGNAVVIFRPDTREQALREALVAADARLVGGPTAADAYVLAIPDRQRDAALAALRGRPEVVLAQPIDPDPSS